MFVHPQYDRFSRKFDIAVWAMTEKVWFTDFVKPLCLPVDGYPVHSSYSVCVAAGWTKLDSGKID